jgi:hypothetical protein
MKLSHKLIPSSKNFNGYWYSSEYNIEDENIALLCIINLHLDKKINDTKLLALFKQYNNKNLIRKVNTFHCKINNKWYNDENTLNIYIECYNEFCLKRDLDIETCLKYFNLLLNKNKNYCIDFLYFNFCEPLINNIIHYDRFNDSVINILTETLSIRENKMSFESFKDTSMATSGYCCSDCDGCLSEYKFLQYRSYLGFDFKEKIEKDIKEELNKLKTYYVRNNFLYNKLA